MTAAARISLWSVAIAAIVAEPLYRPALTLHGQTPDLLLPLAMLAAAAGAPATAVALGGLRGLIAGDLVLAHAAGYLLVAILGARGRTRRGLTDLTATAIVQVPAALAPVAALAIARGAPALETAQAAIATSALTVLWTPVVAAPLHLVAPARAGRRAPSDAPTPELAP